MGICYDTKWDGEENFLELRVKVDLPSYSILTAQIADRHTRVCLEDLLCRE